MIAKMCLFDKAKWCKGANLICKTTAIKEEEEEIARLNLTIDFQS